MDRVAKLTEEAEMCLRFERECAVHWDAARASTRECLTEAARELGFPENEISAAVDTALAGGVAAGSASLRTHPALQRRTRPNDR